MLQRINLVPKIPFSAKLRRWLPLLLAAALLLTIAAVTLADFRLKRWQALLSEEISRLEQDAGRSETLTAKVRHLTGQAEALRQQSADAAAQARKLGAPLAEKLPFSLILAEISQATPPSIRCDKITISRNQGIIHGLAVQYQELPLLVGELRRNPRFAGVTIQDIDRGDERADSPFLFTIIFQLKPPG